MPVPTTELGQPLLAWRDQVRSAYQATVLDTRLPLNVDIGAICAEIRSYETDMALLEEVLSLKRALISSFRLHPLPPEVLSIIFFEFRDEDPATLVATSHVCRLWRHTALGHRSLWSHIELGCHEGGLHRIQCWLDRSYPLPVQLVIHGFGDLVRPGLPMCLLGASERWESIAIHHRASKLDGLSPHQWRFPKLKNLRILDYDCNSLDLASIGAILSNNPSLKSLSIAGFNFDEDGWSVTEMIGLTASTDNLTHISLGEVIPIEQEEPVPVHLILELLSACPNLETFTCHHTRDFEDPLPPAVLSLPSLRELSLGDSDRTCILLRFLNVPQLQSLRIFHPNPQCETSSESDIRQAISESVNFAVFFKTCLEDLQMNCAPSLVRLVLEGSSRSVYSMLPPLAVFRGIREIEFRALARVPEITISSLLLESSGQSQTARWLAPSLHSLAFIDCQSVDFLHLAAMLEMRNRAYTGVKSSPALVEQVLIRGCPNTMEDDRRRILRALQPK